MNQYWFLDDNPRRPLIRETDTYWIWEDQTGFPYEWEVRLKKEPNEAYIFNDRYYVVKFLVDQGLEDWGEVL